MHITAYDEYAKICLQGCFPTNKQITQNDFDEALMKFIVSGGHEFSIIEEPDLIYLLSSEL